MLIDGYRKRRLKVSNTCSRAITLNYKAATPSNRTENSAVADIPDSTSVKAASWHWNGAACIMGRLVHKFVQSDKY